MSPPVISGLLSFVIPGAGQLINGLIFRALFWLIITPGFWIGSGGTLGWICHFVSAYTAYRASHMIEWVLKYEKYENL